MPPAGEACGHVDGSEHTVTAKDVLESLELLPGFSVKVGDLFE